MFKSQGSSFEAAVIKMLDWSVIMKQELTVKVKLFIYWLVYVPTPPMVMTSGYRLKSTKLQIQDINR